MSLKSEYKADLAELKQEIINLEAEVRKLGAQKKTAGEELLLTEEIVALQRQLVKMEVEESKKTEAFEREKREVEHMVGLERKKAEFDKTSSIRDAELKVRESNLGEERRLFEEKMKSVTKNLEERITYLQDNLVEKLMGAVTSAMPNVDLAFAGGNGKRSKVSAES